MGENFIKFKKQVFAIRLIKSVLLGLACGTLLAGIFLLLSKFGIWEVKPVVSLVVGVAVFLLAGAGGYFLLRVSDKEIARRLDEEFALHEKVQTMLAYEKEKGTIYDLQREDANQSIAAIAGKRLPFKRLWIYVVCICIGLGSLISAFVFSPKEESPPVIPDKEFTITEIQVAAMEELIVYVENSQMQSPYKDNVATSLGDLLAELKLAKTETQKNDALAKAVEDIYGQTDDSSMAVELMNALWGCETDSLKRLAEMLNYYVWTQTDGWKDFSVQMTEFRTSFVHADSVTENHDKEKMATETGVLLLRVQSKVEQSLSRAGATDTDALYIQLTRLAETNEMYDNGTHLYGFSTLSTLAETLGYETMQKELDATFATLGAGIFRALEQHRENTDTGEYAMTRLKELFGCTLPKFERPNFYVVSDEETPDNGDGEGGGGAGIGDGAVYGSDDLVLDPLTNTYVEYGTILDKYYALMFGKTQEGDYTEQEKDAMEKYFAILYGGFDEEGE